MKIELVQTNKARKTTTPPLPLPLMSVLSNTACADKWVKYPTLKRLGLQIKRRAYPRMVG